MSKMSSSPKKQTYERFNDNMVDVDIPRIFCSAAVAAKFCSMGLVASEKWFSAFVIIEDGVLRLYDDEQTYKANPSNVVLQISITKNHKASGIKRKNYAQDSMHMTEFFCFYVEIDNGVFFPTRQLKIGCMHKHTAEQLCKAINSISQSY